MSDTPPYLPILPPISKSTHTLLLTSRRPPSLLTYPFGHRRQPRRPEQQSRILLRNQQHPRLCSCYSCLDLCHSCSCVCPIHLCEAAAHQSSSLFLRLVIDFLRKGAMTSLTASELGFMGFLWVLWLGQFSDSPVSLSWRVLIPLIFSSMRRQLLCRPCWLWCR